MIDLDLHFPDRSKLKQEIDILQAQADETHYNLELNKADLYLEYDWKCNKSDLKGRALEFKKACKENLTIHTKEQELTKILQTIKTKEKQLSEINFEQREKMITSMNNVSSVFREFIGSMKQLTDTVKEFNSAVDKLVESRKK